MLLSLVIVFAIAAALGLYLWSAARQELERSRAQSAALESKRVNNDSELRQRDGEVRTLREELQTLKNDLKAQKKKNFETKQARPLVAANDAVELAQLRTELGQWRAAAEQARLEAERLKNEVAKGVAQVVVAAPAPVVDDSAALAERAALQSRITELSHKLESLTAALQAEKQRVGAEGKALLDMRRKVEWHRRIHVVQRGEHEKLEDKLAHVRARYLELCGDYVRVAKMVPHNDKLQAQVLSPEGQKEVAALQNEQTEYLKTQEKTAPAEATPASS